jgi:hypothetical protein
MPFTDDHPEPQIGETVCRIGVSSGQHCGQIAAGQGEDQYLTTLAPVGHIFGQFRLGTQ